MRHLVVEAAGLQSFQRDAESSCVAEDAAQQGRRLRHQSRIRERAAVGVMGEWIGSLKIWTSPKCLISSGPENHQSGFQVRKEKNNDNKIKHKGAESLQVTFVLRNTDLKWT